MFAQESVMDVQKENAKYLASLLANCGATQDEINDLSFDDEVGFFESNRLADWFVSQINFGWRVWQAAEAQAVLEKDAIIQKLSDQLYAQEMKTSAARVLCETACELLDDYAHQDAMVILNDLEQAMKEPAND